MKNEELGIITFFFHNSLSSIGAVDVGNRNTLLFVVCTYLFFRFSCFLVFLAFVPIPYPIHQSDEKDASV